MNEYEILNRRTGEYETIFGYSVEHAFSKTSFDPNEWTVIFWEYVD